MELGQQLDHPAMAVQLVWNLAASLVFSPPLEHPISWAATGSEPPVALAMTNLVGRRRTSAAAVASRIGQRDTRSSYSLAQPKVGFGFKGGGKHVNVLAAA